MRTIHPLDVKTVCIEVKKGENIIEEIGNVPLGMKRFFTFLDMKNLENKNNRIEFMGLEISGLDTKREPKFRTTLYPKEHDEIPKFDVGLCKIFDLSSSPMTKLVIIAEGSAIIFMHYHDW